MKLSWIPLKLNKPNTSKTHLILHETTRIDVHHAEVDELCDCYNIITTITHWTNTEDINLPRDVRDRVQKIAKREEFQSLSKYDYRKPYRVLNCKKVM